MTEDALEFHRADRRARMEAFVANPERYQVCDLCQSISLQKVGLCPVCGGYCFHTDAATVIATAKIIGSNPFPLTAGVVPRLEGCGPKSGERPYPWRARR